MHVHPRTRIRGQVLTTYSNTSGASRAMGCAGYGLNQGNWGASRRFQMHFWLHRFTHFAPWCVANSPYKTAKSWSAFRPSWFHGHAVALTNRCVNACGAAVRSDWQTASLDDCTVQPEPWVAAERLVQPVPRLRSLRIPIKATSRELRLGYYTEFLTNHRHRMHLKASSLT